MTISSSTKDYRFTPVTPPELNKIKIEISVLTPMKKIENIDEIELGRHGIYIRKGSQSGTFLPQVADKTGWTVEEFLGHCARIKPIWVGWMERCGDISFMRQSSLASKNLIISKY